MQEDTVDFPGVAINKGFFPVLVPVGITGNVLSFLVREYNMTSFLGHVEFNLVFRFRILSGICEISQLFKRSYLWPITTGNQRKVILVTTFAFD